MDPKPHLRIQFWAFAMLFLGNSAWSKDLRILLEEYKRSSPDFAAEVSRAESVRRQATAVNAYAPPQIGVEWGNRAVSPGMSNETMYYKGLIVGQEISFPGKISSMQGSEAERVHMTAAEARIVQRRLGFRIARTYLEIHLIQQRLLVLDSGINALSALLESVRRRYETGMVGVEEVFRLQSELARWETDSIKMEGERRMAEAMLAAAVGSEDSVSVPSQISFRDSGETIPSADSMEILQLQLPVVAAMEANARMAAKEREVARLAVMPDLMLQGKYMVMDGPSEWALMASVQVPIAPWASSISSSAKATSQAKEAEADARLRAMKVMIAQECKAAIVRLQATEDRMHKIRQRLAAAENTSQASLTAFGNGKADLSMVLDAVRMRIMAQEEVVMARVERLQAILALEETSGVAPTTWLQETSAVQGVEP